MNGSISTSPMGAALISYCEEEELRRATDADQRRDGTEFAAGVALSIAASVFSNVGLNLQKWSIMREARTRPAAAVRPYVRRSQCAACLGCRTNTCC